MSETTGTPPLEALRDLDHLLEKLEASDRLDHGDLARLRDDITRVLKHGETRATIHAVLHALARGHQVHVTSTAENLTPAQVPEDLLAELERVWQRERSAGRRVPSIGAAQAAVAGVRATLPAGQVPPARYRNTARQMPGEDNDDRRHAAAAISGGATRLLTTTTASLQTGSPRSARSSCHPTSTLRRRSMSSPAT